MGVDIGTLIKKELKNQGLNYKEFGKLINRHEKTVASILKRKTVDTQLLLSISKALNYDFFFYYYDEEPLKGLREQAMSKVSSEISQLKSSLQQKDEYISTQNKYVQSQEEVIRLLKEKERFLGK